MANESFAAAYAPPRDVTRSLIAEIVFVALLLVMFVGLLSTEWFLRKKWGLV